MELLEQLLGVGASVATGGLFGLFGSVVGAVGKYFQEKQRQAWETKKMGHELKLLDIQAKAQQVENEQELKVVDQAGSWTGLRESLVADNSTGPTHMWVNDVKSLFRPVLTTGLIAVTVSFFFQILWAMEKPNSGLLQFFTQSELVEMLVYLVRSIVFTTSTAVTWWFGDRALTPPHMKVK